MTEAEGLAQVWRLDKKTGQLSFCQHDLHQMDVALSLHLDGKLPIDFCHPVKELGLRRRSSKASRDGSLSENIEKADIRASPSGISTSPDRGSEREPKWERRDRKRASAERSFRASPRVRAIANHSISSGGKIGSSGKHCVKWIHDVEDENRRLFQGKTPGRELLRYNGRYEDGDPLGVGCHEHHVPQQEENGNEPS